MSMGLMCWFLLVDAPTMMVMELESRLSPSEVMDVLSIVYFQIWLEPGHENKLTGYMNTLKQTYGRTKDISSATHVYDTCLVVLSGMALDQQFHWFAVAMANNSPHAMRAMDTHIHPLTKLWRALAQSGPLKSMFPEFFKLAKIAMIQERGYILIQVISLKFLMLFVFMFLNVSWLLTDFVSLHPFCRFLGAYKMKEQFPMFLS